MIFQNFLEAIKLGPGAFPDTLGVRNDGWKVQGHFWIDSGRFQKNVKNYQKFVILDDRLGTDRTSGAVFFFKIRLDVFSRECSPDLLKEAKTGWKQFFSWLDTAGVWKC